MTVAYLRPVAGATMLRDVRWMFSISLCAALLTPSPAAAHDFSITDTLVVLKSNGTYQIDLTLDVDAVALGIPSKLKSPERVAELRRLDEPARARLLENVRTTLRSRYRIRFDGRPVEPVISFPEYGVPPAATAIAPPSFFGATARFVGRIPEGATDFVFGATADAGVIYLTILDQGYAVGVKQVLSGGADSPAIRLDRPPESKQSVSGPESTVIVAARYLVLGFEHILPRGLDHILFVLGLFLLSPRLKPLLWQVSAFTVAHTLTLALSVYGIVHLPSRLVESMIALSIAYVAVENIFTSDLKPWRPALVFGFGLLHGLGFAGVLRDLGLPRDEFVTSLLAFNAGVECGQLAVIALASLAVGWFRRREWYRKTIVIPLSAAIALVGAYWAFERAVYGA